MSDKQVQKKSSLDCVEWNESDASERSSSDRIYSPYDIAILQRLQFLTQRVEYLENKLEKSLTSQQDDLSFGLSVDHRNNVPNVDIKVLSGHQDRSREGDHVMDGWDDAIVERNTSFLIIPVGDDKDMDTNNPQMLKQTLDLSLKPVGVSRPALCCSDTYQQFIDDNSGKETRKVPEQSTKRNSISFEIRQPPVKTYAQSTNHRSWKNLPETENDTANEGKRVTHEKKCVEIQHAVMSEHDQEINDLTNNMSKLTTSPERDVNNNTVKYGYTIGVTTSPNKDTNGEKYPSLNHRLPPVDKKDDTVNYIDTFGNHQNYIHKGHSLNNKIQSTLEQAVSYQDVQICEVVQYEDKFDSFDRTIDVKIQRRISNENCVYSQTNSGEYFGNQSKNARNDAGVFTVKEEPPATNRLNENPFGINGSREMNATVIHDDNIKRKMQIPDTNSQALKEDHFIGIDTNDAMIPEHNAKPKKRLPHNSSHFNTNRSKDAGFCVYNGTAIHTDTKHHAVNKPSIKKVRVRSVEVPYTSSDDDILSCASELSTTNYNSYKNQRPQRRKPKSKTAKQHETENKLKELIEPREIGNVHEIENKLKELIDPNEIGNVREEIQASHRPLLLSPTKSDFVSSNSPSDELRESSFTSVSPYERTLSCPDSPCSSIASSAATVQCHRAPPSPRMLHQSVGSSSVSSTSEHSQSKPCHDKGLLSFGNSRLNDVLPGPTRLSLSDYSPTQLRLSEFLLASEEHSVASETASSVVTSDLSDSFLECQDEFCQCQTGISTEDDFREELKSISRYVIEAGEKSGKKRKRSSLKKLFLDDEQGEMDIFGAKLQKGEHRAVPLLVKVILRLRKHFFGGLEGPHSLKSLTPIQNKQFFPEEKSGRAKKITFSPSAMLLSAVGESSASEIRHVIEKDNVDVNELSPSGKSLLHKAAASGNLESIHTLIQYGADVNLPDQDGFAPVHAALRRCHYKCAIFLIECGTDMAAYTRARIQEIADINNIARAYKKTVLNTAL